jgi:ADP-ribose pyrophosphatase YjhB (NUDIX family)
MTSDARPVVGVGAMIFDEKGRVLLARRGKPPGKGLYTVPGGRVELGETLTRACAREVREETGLEVDVGRLVEVVERVSRDPGGGILYHFVIVDYLASVRGGTARPGDDCSELKWATREELAKLPTTEGLLPVIERARRLWARTGT